MNTNIKIAFWIITALRLAQLAIDCNFDKPDEYWQGT